MDSDRNKKGAISRVWYYAKRFGMFDCDAIVTGISGGPDSVALLRMLKEFAVRFEDFPELYAVHVNHNLRGDEAVADMKFTEEFCEQAKIPLKVFSFDVEAEAVKNKRTEEEMGRILRYRAFDEVAEGLSSGGRKVRIAVAHHQGDVAETMMMDLMRGTGLEGLVAPKPVTERIIRPFLCLSKEDILGYLKSREQDYCEDSTNLASDYTRNFYRNEIFPKIKEFSGIDPVCALGRTYDLLSDDLDLLTDMAEMLFQRSHEDTGGKVFLRSENVSHMHPAMRTRMIRLLWERTFGDRIDLGLVNIRIAEDALLTGDKKQQTYHMPFGRILYTANGYFTFCAEDGIVETACLLTRKMGFLTSCGKDDGSKVELELDLTEPNTAVLPDSGIQIDVDIIENIDELRYNDYSWICPLDGPLPKIAISDDVAGCCFRKAGSSGGKKLGKLLSDLHVPAGARSKVLAVTKDGEVVYVPGAGHAEGFVSEVSRKRWEESRRSKDGIAAERFAVITFSGNEG